MNTLFNAHLIDSHMRELAETAERDRRSRDQAEAVEREAADCIWVRLATPEDSGALLRLAELDSRSLPGGPKLVAEVGGQLVAAMSLAGREAVADPFRHTADLVELLRLRAVQLTEGHSGARRRLPWLVRSSSRPARAA